MNEKRGPECGFLDRLPSKNLDSVWSEPENLHYSASIGYIGRHLVCPLIFVI